MAEVVTRLIVDSQDYDAKIKRASQGLQHYAEECRKAGGTLEYVDEEAMQFAKTIGEMSSVAGDARGKMMEYTNAIVGLTTMYREMTAEEKKSDFGKALSASIDQLKAKAGTLKDVMSDTNMELRNIASDTAFTDGIGLMTRTVGSCAAAVSAWAGENKEAGVVIKELAKIGTTVAAVESLTKAFQKQNLVLLKNPYVAAAAAIAAIGVAIAEAVSHANDLTEAEQLMQDVQQNAIEICAKEITQIQALNSIIHDNTRSIDERRNAITDLQSIVPDYHGALTDEGNLINDNTSAIDDYVAGLKKAALAQAAFDKMVELQKSKLNKELELKKAIQKRDQARKDYKEYSSSSYTSNTGSAGVGGFAVGSSMAQEAVTAENKVNSLQKEIDKDNEKIKQLEGVIDAEGLGAGGSSRKTNTSRTTRTTRTTPNRSTRSTSSSRPVVEVEPVLPEGSAAALRKQISDLQKEWDMASTQDERDSIDAKIKAANEELDRMQGKVAEVAKEEKKLYTGIGEYTQDAVDARLKLAQEMLSSSNLGSSDYMIAADKIVDLTSFQNLMQAAIQSGVEMAPQDIIEKLNRIDAGIGISDSEWQEFVDQINAQLAELELPPIELDVKTGGVENVAQEAKSTADAWQNAVSAVQNVGDALQQIEDPAAKVSGIVMQAIANIALGFAQAAASPATGAAGVFGWIAAATAGVATMASTIAAIKSATSGSYASGGIIPGSSYSGDNMLANVNSGELILNRAQQSNIAGQLNGKSPMSNMRLSTEVSGSNLRIVLNNDNRGRGGSRDFYSKIH